jgi:fructose-1,6-bisphosphatase/inositol monophosphatase family enzyme
MNPFSLLAPLQTIHDRIRDSVVAATERQSLQELARVSRNDEGDTIYAIDVVSEELLLELFTDLSREHAFVLIAEGLPHGRVVLPRGADEATAAWRIIVDPIDGTRGLMYQKRSAWILTGVAPNRGANTSLSDVVLAIQTEIPLIKQHLSDQLWAVRGEGAQAVRFNRLTGAQGPISLRPSNSPTIAHGFAMIARFVPGLRDELAAIDEEIVSAALGPVQPGKAACFEDQYISTGGQLYELTCGHDRFVADLRPLLEPLAARRGLRLGLCCHPYDLSAALIASELGVALTDGAGAPMNAPLNVSADVDWVGYANDSIRQQIEPLLQAALRKRGLIA